MNIKDIDPDQIKVGTIVKFHEDMSKSRITPESYPKFSDKIGVVTSILDSYEKRFYTKIDGKQNGHCGADAFEVIYTKEEYPEYYL